ncbi:unnamed protein product [Pleuronectes platessa]|uniref:Uncharacterized protein n=1 Tax=Pleuronectes platessa TaxID=8262 RepID=A0A9N7U2I1_PLEPL|nr:unnamed protein product [Pleuronectes platessa]
MFPTRPGASTHFFIFIFSILIIIFISIFIIIFISLFFFVSISSSSIITIIIFIFIFFLIIITLIIIIFINSSSSAGKLPPVCAPGFQPITCCRLQPVPTWVYHASCPSSSSLPHSSFPPPPLGSQWRRSCLPARPAIGRAPSKLSVRSPACQLKPRWSRALTNGCASPSCLRTEPGMAA